MSSPQRGVVPPIAHFVFGLRPQSEPFHLVHYLAIESCRRVLAPERIFLHHKWLPYGVYWDLIRPHLTLVHADEATEVLAADYDANLVPEHYRYAHHADFVRLEALIEHGGVYADIDTLFLRPFPDELYHEQFVIGEEDPVRDERTGEVRPSLCNAVLISARGSEFARAWRARMGDALNGTWSNHSGFLARALADELSHALRVEPRTTFFPAPCTAEGLQSLLEGDDVSLDGALSVHLWAHLWWGADRGDFSGVHAGVLTADYIRSVDTTYNRLARPYVPEIDLW
ncbi:MAG: glycosyltransferase [Acidimicrobiia bacterium]